MTENRPAHFLPHCEMQDASQQATMLAAADSPAAASIELAKLTAHFETQIDDDWRAMIIRIGGALIRLDREMDEKPAEVRASG